MRWVLIAWFVALTKFGTFVCDDNTRICLIGPDPRWQAVWWTGMECNWKRCLTLTLNYHPVNTFHCVMLGATNAWQCGELPKEEEDE